MNELSSFLVNFAFNFLAAFLVVRFIYYPSTQNKAYVFTFLAFNTIIYFVLHFMKSIEIGFGVGFGLFAVFSILRYRTDPIPIREMTYLFIIAALPLMNSVGIVSDLWPQLALANIAVLAIMAVLEKEWGFRYETSKPIVYEKIELIRPERRAELLADLEKRTGLKIKRVVIGKVDFLHDVANLRVYYHDQLQDDWLNGAEVTATVNSNEAA